MKTLTQEDIKLIIWKLEHTTTRWHEGCQVIGYWAEGDSFIFKGHDNHHFAVTRGFIEKVARGEIEWDDTSAD